MIAERTALLWSASQPLLRGAAPVPVAAPSEPRRRTHPVPPAGRITAALARLLFLRAAPDARASLHRRGRP